MHIWRPLWGWGGVRKNWDVIGRRRVGCSECSGRPYFIFFIKENCICVVTRYQEEPNNNYWQEIFLLTLPSGSETSIYWYHCIVCGLNGTIELVVNSNIMCLGFVFVLILFVHMHSITWRGRFVWNWTSKVKGIEEFWT